MKNHDEFRRTVFEKAERYEKRCKARNRKIMETVSLCSLCLIVGISAYFGIHRLDLSTKTAEVDGLRENPLYTSAPWEEIQNNSSLSTTQIEETLDGTLCPAETTAAPMTTAVTPTTSAKPTTATSTTPMVETSTVATDFTGTESTLSTGASLDSVHLGSYPCDEEMSEGSADACELFIFSNLAAWKQYAEISCLSKSEAEDLTQRLSHDFFETRALIVLHLSNIYNWEMQKENSDWFFEISKNTSEYSGDTLHIYSVSKDDFQSAKLISVGE